MSAIRRASDLGTRGTVVIADGSVTPSDLASQAFSFPSNTRFRAARSGNLGGYNPDTGATQANPVVFNSVDYNVGSAYNSSTGRFTAPVAATYVFQASVYQSGPIQQMWWIVNGTRERTFFNDHNAQSINIAGSGLIYLNQGDTVGVCSWSGGATVTVYDNWYHTYFRGSLVG